MKKIRAFYYKENYYCFLPGEDLTVEELRASRGGKGIQMNVTRLSRKNCLPPYFVTGQQETVTMRLKPWHMYPVTAYLLSRKEYDARLLKKVEKICPGCLHYGGDGTQLEEHCYLEMGLDGSCPYRQEQSRYSLQAAAATAWQKLSKKNKALRELVDAEEYDKAAELVRQTIRPHLGPLAGCRVELAKHGERYALMFSGQGSSVLRLYMDFVARMAPAGFRRSWDVYSCLPRGVYKYRPEEQDLRSDPPMARFFTGLYDRPRLDVTMLVKRPEGREDAPNGDAYRYLCGQVGEERMLATIVGLDYIERDDGNGGFANLGMLSQEIDQLLDGREPDPKELPTVCYRPHQDRPMRGGPGQTVVTRSLELSNQLVMGRHSPLADHLIEDMETALLSIFVDLPGETVPDFGGECSWRLNSLADPLTKADAAKLIGYTIGGQRMCLDLLVTNLRLAQGLLREYAPMLMDLHGTFCLQSNRMAMWFAGDYALTQLDGPRPEDGMW